MYAFESNSSRGPLHAMVIGSVVAAVALFTVAGFEGMPVPYVFQILAVVCLTATVYLVSRYSLKSYRYAIEPSGITSADGTDVYDLVITEIMGKRCVVVCRVALRDIDASQVSVLRRDEKAARDMLCKGKRVFRYENTPITPDSCYIPLPSESSVVIIPPDEQMMKVLKGSE